VIAMFAVAAGAAAFAWWWNYNRGKQALELYGPEGAYLIRTAPVVEYLNPPPADPIDISKAPGLINARASLLSDASYEWEVSDNRQESSLSSVRFKRGDQSIVVKFDFVNRTIHASTTQRTAKLAKKTADGWQSYLTKLSGAQAAVSK
jgi:hypothetical protein